MATVHTFVGQCGNQLGSAFLDAIATDAEASTSDEYQMLVSSTHFRPALRPTRAQRSGKQKQTYYSLSNGAPMSHCDVSSLPQPRCVMVDMEPKVIEAAVQRANTRSSSAAGGAGPSAPLYCLAPQQCVTRGEGSGNNWGYGYYTQGESRREDIAECLQRECEVCDTRVSCFHAVHSIAGGTGSGVGCVVAEVIKELYPRASLLHTLVWPFSCGEVVTQWYNVILSLSTLRDVVDGAFIAYNDTIGKSLMGTLAHRGLPDAGEVSYNLMNDTISQLLAPLHLPQQLCAVPPPQKNIRKNRITHPLASQPDAAEDASHYLRRYVRSEDVIEALSLDPAMKFFTGTHIPQMPAGGSTWASVMEEAAHVSRERLRCMSAFAGVTASRRDALARELSMFSQSRQTCLWALRGGKATSDGLRVLQDTMLSSPHAPFPLSTLFVSPAATASAAAAAGGGAHADHEVTLYGPSTEIGVHLAEALRRAEALLDQDAFVHHLTRYGVEKAELEESTARLWDTVAAYAS